MSTIPANQIVQVTPSVLGAGGSGLDVIGLLLSSSARVPVGTVQSFPSPAAVSDFFGPGDEADLATIYFNGFEGADVLPASVLFAQYPEVEVAAYLRGGDVSALTLTQVQAIAGTLAITVDGYARSAGSVDLSTATSFSSAAGILQTELNAGEATLAHITGSISTTVLTVSAFSSGAPLAIGQEVRGAGVTAGTVITALGSGTGGTGTYTVNHSQTVGSEALTTTGTDVAVTYDSVSGAFVVTSGITGAPSTVDFATGSTAATLKLTSATGAVVSQGAAAASPGTFMDGVVAVTTDWVTFMTVFDPDGGSGNTIKQAFDAWSTAQNNRYAYVCWDPDAGPAAAEPDAGSLGQILAANGSSGTALCYNNANLAAFVCGVAASIDFEKTNGRVDFAFKSQDGFVATVTTATAANNLAGSPQTSDRGNGYNFYGAYAAANQAFTWFQRGFVTGAFLWLDSYINQIWLNNAIQLALLELLKTAKSIPYTAAGFALIEAALADPINAAINFGAIAPGAISSAQAAEVNGAAGADVAGTLQTQGYYLQILPATSSARAARTSPPMTLWYLDRGSVQAMTLASVAVQ